MTHTETMASFAPDIKSRMNEKIFWDLKMAEKCLERLVFEPTTILDYSKLLSNFRVHFGGQGTTGQQRGQCLSVRFGMDNGRTQLLNCQWNSSDIDTCQMLKYQSSEPQTYIFS